ncbi:MAG: CRISPR-associated protein Cas4 [Anaerolineae bacterium]|nr:CRISPR-associated protein Cas4 [Anaerolineae bacterium]
MNATTLIILAFGLFLIALFLLRGGRNTQQRQGLPPGRVVYDDSSRKGGEASKPLYSARLGLSGKPDYIVQQHGVPIPVEVKSRRAPRTPYDSHLYQLAAYCMLVEEQLGIRPPYGLIRYSDRTFQIDFTAALEEELLAVLGEMRKEKVSIAPPRSHDDPARCAGCGFREVCEERLI